MGKHVLVSCPQVCKGRSLHLSITISRISEVKCCWSTGEETIQRNGTSSTLLSQHYYLWVHNEVIVPVDAISCSWKNYALLWSLLYGRNMISYIHISKESKLTGFTGYPKAPLSIAVTLLSWYQCTLWWLFIGTYVTLIHHVACEGTTLCSKFCYNSSLWQSTKLKNWLCIHNDEQAIDKAQQPLSTSG